MSFGPITIFSAEMVNGADTFVVSFPKAYRKIFVECPSMTTAADRQVFASQDGTNWQEAIYPVVSGLTSPTSMIIGSGVTNKIFHLDLHAKYIRFKASAAVVSGNTYYFHCSD